MLEFGNGNDACSVGNGDLAGTPESTTLFICREGSAVDRFAKGFLALVGFWVRRTCQVGDRIIAVGLVAGRRRGGGGWIVALAVVPATGEGWIIKKSCEEVGAGSGWWCRRMVWRTRMRRPPRF